MVTGWISWVSPTEGNSTNSSPYKMATYGNFQSSLPLDFALRETLKCPTTAFPIFGMIDGKVSEAILDIHLFWLLRSQYPDFLWNFNVCFHNDHLGCFTISFLVIHNYTVLRRSFLKATWECSSIFEWLHGYIPILNPYYTPVIQYGYYIHLKSIYHFF